MFADESGLSSQCVYGRTWGVAGKTPVVRLANSRFRVNMLVAISPEGEIYYMIHEGLGTAERSRQFLENTVREIDRKMLIVVDNCSIHKVNRSKEWIAGQADDGELFYQPTYAPEVNPVELVWALIEGKGRQ